jgi:epsilon-lactone hydrolase
MPGLKTRLFLFTVRNRHLFQGHLKREVITYDSDTNALRKQFEAGAKKFGSIPAGVCVSPVEIPGLAPGHFAEWIHPEGSPNVPTAAEKAIFYTHGGGYVSGNCVDHRMHVAKFVRDTGTGALLYDYRLAPEHSFPAAIEDTLIAYRWLLAQGVLPKNVIVVGESAGGGLCLASLLAFRDEGLPLPAAGVALSPWLDIASTADSFKRNALRDISTLNSWNVWGDYYAGAHDKTHPWMSPIHGDLRGLPPVRIVVGTDEVMLDDACRFAEKASQAGVAVTLRVSEGMVHCFPLFAPAIPEATQAWEETMAYIREQLQ